MHRAVPKDGPKGFGVLLGLDLRLSFSSFCPRATGKKIRSRQKRSRGLLRRSVSARGAPLCPLQGQLGRHSGLHERGGVHLIGRVEVEGDFIRGARPYKVFKSALDAMLAKTKTVN